VVVENLSYPSLVPERRVLLRALGDLAADADTMMRTLKLGRTLGFEVQRNQELLVSATMPALDRYTGVLFDGLDSGSLPPDARAFAGEHLLVHSALFGPVGALDLIPAYRLSHDSKLPNLVLKKHWAASTSALLGAESGLFLDLRSEGYVGLGPAPKRPESYFLRVVTESSTGARRALNHFNKKAKGEFTRALLLHGEDFSSGAELISWAPVAGFDLRFGVNGELDLVVSGTL
jgi:cytoplasmic iron level regulating protein YaaA (DUF328/UPF0246 family)